MTGTTRNVDRYLAVGVFNTAFDIALFTLLAVVLDVPPVLANVVSTLVVMTVSFFLNRAWVFRSQVTGLGAYLRFSAITLFSGLLVQSLVIVGVLAASATLWPGLSEDLAKPGAKVVAVAVGMVVNFLGYRWLFAGRSTPEVGSIAGPRSP